MFARPQSTPALSRAPSYLPSADCPYPSASGCLLLHGKIRMQRMISAVKTRFSGLSVENHTKRIHRGPIINHSEYISRNSCQQPVVSAYAWEKPRPIEPKSPFLCLRSHAGPKTRHRQSPPTKSMQMQLILRFFRIEASHVSPPCILGCRKTPPFLLGPFNSLERSSTSNGRAAL